MYVNKTENRITFKIKIRYYHKLLRLKTIKHEKKINKNKNGEKIPHI